MFGTTRTHWYQYLTVLTVLLGVVPAFFFAVRAEESPEGGFTINPTRYDVTVTSLEPVVVEFTLTNPFSEELAFSLGVEEGQKQALLDNQVELTYLSETSGVDILNGVADIVLAAESEEKLLIEVKPTVEEDFNSSVAISLIQAEGERNLQQSKYDLELNIASKVASNKKALFTESIAGGLVVLGVIIAGLIFLFKPEKASKDGKKSDQ